MANHGFGAGGFPPGGFGGPGSEDIESLARQYWSRWGEMLRAGAQPGFQAGAFPAGGGFPGAGFANGGFAGGFPGMAGMPGTGFGSGAPEATGAGGATMPGWNEAVAWWSQLATGAGAGQPADAAVERFNAQARGWFAQMQQLAAQFAGQDASAADIAKTWKRIFGGVGVGTGGNPFGDALRDMQGPGQQGFEHWFQQAAPWLETLQRNAQAQLGTPAFGFTREHQQRWQQLAQAQQDYQQQNQAYQALMAEATQDAFQRFEEKLAERSEPGKQLESARALFDLWIDAAEEAYADIALSPRFRDAYGALVNAQMRLRSAVQREVEQAGEAMGMPTRTEVDAAHRKIVQLERELRRLRDQLQPASASPRPAASPRGGDSAPEPTAPRLAKKAAAGTAKAASAAVPAKRAPTGPAAAKKTKTPAGSKPVAEASTRPATMIRVATGAAAKKPATAKKATTQKTTTSKAADKSPAKAATPPAKKAAPRRAVTRPTRVR